MTRLKRMMDEKEELDTKIEKLRNFIWDGNKQFKKLPMVDVDLLMTQHHTMRQYSEILLRRIQRG